jgi:hypothetical protein
MIPKFRPEKRAERSDRPIINTKRHHSVPLPDSTTAAVALAIVELIV